MNLRGALPVGRKNATKIHYNNVFTYDLIPPHAFSQQHKLSVFTTQNKFGAYIPSEVSVTIWNPAS